MTAAMAPVRPTSAPIFLERWITAYPRRVGVWTLRTPDGRWGTLDPEQGHIRPVEPCRDVKLPALKSALRRGSLIGYRSGRRAIIATPDSYIKVVRPKRFDALVAGHELLAATNPRFVVPRVIAADNSGWIELSAIRGPALHEILHRPFRGDEVPSAIERVARGLAAFHNTPAPDELSTRSLDPPDRWIETVARVEPDAAVPLARVARDLPDLGAAPQTLIHGDLHDKNIIVSDSGVGLIDFDNTGRGSPEDDVANLAVHLQLRSLQARQPSAVGEARADLLYHAYRNERALDTDRLAAVERHTWFRLACLYRFRRSGRHLTFELLRRATPLRARALAGA